MLEISNTLPVLEISNTAADSLALLIRKYTTVEFVTREITRIAYFVSGPRDGITLITASSEREKLQIRVEDIQWITKVIVCNTSLSLQSLHIEDFLQAAESLIKAESIIKALANNDSLALKRLTLPTLRISDTAADSLALFIQKCATLEFVSWKRSRTTLITACGLREMANAEHHYSWLPPAATGEDHHCVVSCIEDGIDFDHIWQHHLFHGAFTCHNIGDEGACSFGASLIKNSTVRRLYFNSNHAHPVLTKVLHHGRHHLTNKKISDAGVTALAQALHHNSRLEKLDLSNNSVSDAGATAIAQALHHNSTLQQLDLSNNSITDAGVTAIAQALHHNSTLRELNLSNNSLSDAGTTAIAQALHHNSTLWELDLSNNSVSDAGTTAVAQALHHNSTLRELDLSNNSVCDAGATAVAQALHHNSTLQQLGLSNNSLSDAGATAVAQALHHTSTLWKLDLSNNSIGDAGATALAQGFHRVSRLGGLNLSGNDAIHKEGTCELVHALTVTTYPEWWWTQCGGLVLPKRCEEFATQCPEYVQVKTRVKFV